MTIIMKIMKRVIRSASILLILFLIFVLSSCDDPATDTEAAKKPISTPTPTSASTEKPAESPASTPTIVPAFAPLDVYDKPDFVKKSTITVPGYFKNPEKFTSDMMVDGNPDTRWAYDQPVSDIMFDFGSPFILSKIKFSSDRTCLLL